METYFGTNVSKNPNKNEMSQRCVENVVDVDNTNNTNKKRTKCNSVEPAAHNIFVVSKHITLIQW